MRLRFHNSRWLIAAVAWSAASFAVIGQAPAPTTQNPAGQVQAPQPQPPSPPGQGRGRGLGGGRKDDPINADVDWTKQPPLLARTPEEQLKTFILQPGYRLELVLADPIIQEPTAIAFDGNGRMFVVEDRSYMLDLDMTGQLDPISRVSLHVDTDNDGKYDKHTVFVDNLVFPRFVTPFGPGVILTKESNAQEVWKYTDTNGDGVADKKELFDTGYGRLANIEGQEAFLTWAMDNWMYSTYNAFRARWTPHGVLKEPTGSNGGEWGVTQDNDGKIWFESGAPGVPSGFQFPIVYGNFNVPDQFEPDFRIPWGAPIRIADMQGGMAVTRMPDGSLKSVTSSAGNDMFRGHRLPQGARRRALFRRAGRAHRPADSSREQGGIDDPPQRVSRERVHQVARPVLPSGRRDDRAGRDAVHHRHVPRHHPGRELHGTRLLPALEGRAVQPGQGDPQGPHLAIGLRRRRAGSIRQAAARSDRAADAQRDRGTAREASQPSQRLVARHGAAAPGPQAGQVRRPRPAGDRQDLAEPARAFPRAVDARRAWRAQRDAGAAADGRSRTADAHPGDPRQRNALQGRRAIVGERLQGVDEGPERRRRDSGDADAESLEGSRCRGHDQDDHGEQPGPRRAGRRLDGPESAGRRAAAAAAIRSPPTNRRSSIAARRSTTSCASPAMGRTASARRNPSSPRRWRRRWRVRRA